MKTNIISIITFFLLFTGFQAFTQEKKIATNQAEYEFMLDGDLALGKQQQYSSAGQYNDYIGGYRFQSVDVIKDLEYRYVGTVIIIIDEYENREVVCIPYLNRLLTNMHQDHLKKLFKNKKLALAYSEFMARRTAFHNSVSYHALEASNH